MENEIKFAMWILQNCKIWSNGVDFRDCLYDYEDKNDMEELYKIYEYEN